MNWSEVIEVTSPSNAGMDKLARAGVLAGRTWFVWETNDPGDSDGTDMDIVMLGWDGQALGPIIEVTAPSDGVEDHYVEVATDDELLCTAWLSRNVTSNDGGFDVWGRVFDGVGWVNPPMRLNPLGQAGVDRVAVAVHDGRAYFAWSACDGTRSGRTSIVMRSWSLGGGLGDLEVVSSRSGSGRNLWPSLLEHDGSVCIAWSSSDDGLALGGDTDIVCRRGRPGEDGDLDLDAPVEVSSRGDRIDDRCPRLFAFHGVVECVWMGESNYTRELWDGIDITSFHSWDVMAASVDASLDDVIVCGCAFEPVRPFEDEDVTPVVRLDDHAGDPVDGLEVVVEFQRSTGGPSDPWRAGLRDLGGGAYEASDLVFPRPGTYEVSVLVNGVEVDAVKVDVDAGTSVNWAVTTAVLGLLIVAGTVVVIRKFGSRSSVRANHGR